jgi:hypothetical protein
MTMTSTPEQKALPAKWFQTEQTAVAPLIIATEIVLASDIDDDIKSLDDNVFSESTNNGGRKRKAGSSRSKGVGGAGDSHNEAMSQLAATHTKRTELYEARVNQEMEYKTQNQLFELRALRRTFIKEIGGNDFLDIVQLHKLYLSEIKEGRVGDPFGEESLLREDWNSKYDEARCVSLSEEDARVRLEEREKLIGEMGVEHIASFKEYMTQRGKQFAETRRPRDVSYDDEFYDRKEDVVDSDDDGDSDDDDGDFDDDNGDSDDDDGDSDDDNGDSDDDDGDSD